MRIPLVIYRYESYDFVAVPFRISVSPSDNDLLDFAECIKEKGPGPISNSRRFQGLPTLIMRREHGHRVPCLPLPPHQGKLGRDPTPPPPPSKLLI